MNPYSFVGAFSAPIFNKVSSAELIDTSLAVEDGDQISKMQSLQHFIWTSPKDHSDPSLETGRLHRLVLQSLNGEVPSHMLGVPFEHNGHPAFSANTNGGNSGHLTTAAATAAAAAEINLSPNAALKLSTRAKKLKKITLHTSHDRCLAFVKSVDPIKEMAVEQPSASGSGKESKASATRSDTATARTVLGQEATDTSKSIQVTTHALPRLIIDEWQALQEEVCSGSYRWDDYDRLYSSKPAPNNPVDLANLPAFPADLAAETVDSAELEPPKSDGKYALRLFHTRWLASL